MLLESAPRCILCKEECPNGLVKYPELILCQNSWCRNYGLFQAWDRVMKELMEQFPHPTT